MKYSRKITSLYSLISRRHRATSEDYRAVSCELGKFKNREKWLNRDPTVVNSCMGGEWCVTWIMRVIER